MVINLIFYRLTFDTSRTQRQKTAQVAEKQLFYDLQYCYQRD